ncbi:MAG: VCBS repeat-containing protein, partial [Deltaproteobacteria bacterium]|nr:VCBS repeat-containing protein [Deltaproteobacteria bacterium]
DGDTVPDLVTANYYIDTVSVLLGNGDGSFQSAASFAAGDGSGSVAVEDLDGDTVPDLVTANHYEGSVSVLLGNGDGSFQAAAFYAAGEGPRSVAIADLDGDGALDLTVANNFSDEASVLLGNGDGSFQAAVSYAVGESPVSIAVADLDNDTIPDLVTANLGSHDVSVLLGNGDGSFRSDVFFLMGYGPVEVAAADLDGDSLLDLVTTNRSSSNVSVLLNSCDPVVCPKIDIEPASESNPVNPKSRGVISVAILGSENFAVSDIDLTTLAFGPDAAATSHDLTKPGAFEDHLRDVNADGLTDLVSHYRIENTGIDGDETEACLVGKTLDGTPFKGCDAIRVLGAGPRIRR